MNNEKDSSDEMKEEIFYRGLEASARQTWRAIKNQDRPDIIIAILVRILKEYYDKGHEDCKNKVKY